MAFNPVVAVCDACILYPFHLRNVIVQAGVDRLVHARWTDEIHDYRSAGRDSLRIREAY